MIGLPLDRVDGPTGETKVRASCSQCAADGRAPDSQVKWERLKAMLDELDAHPTEYERTIRFP